MEIFDDFADLPAPPPPGSSGDLGGRPKSAMDFRPTSKDNE